MYLGGNLRTGYMTQEQEMIRPDQSALESILHLAPFKETEARAFLSNFFIFNHEPLRPTRDLSIGERTCYEFVMLDEPLNHLEIPSRTHFEQALATFEATFLAIEHDRYFIEHFANEIWLAEDNRIKRIYV